MPGIPILALEGLTNAAAYRKHCDKTDSSPDMTSYTDKDWSRIQDSLLSADRSLSGWFIHLISVHHRILHKDEAVKLLSLSVFRNCKKLLIDSIRSWFEFFLFENKSIHELRNGIHNLHHGGTEPLHDFKSDAQACGLSELQIEAYRLENLLQDIQSSSQRSMGPSLNSQSSTYWSLQIWKNGQVTQVPNGSNPFNGDVQPILALYISIEEKSQGLIQAIVDDDDLPEDSDTRVPQKLPSLDDIMASGDPDLLIVSLTTWLRTVTNYNSSSQHSPGPNQVKVLQEINSLVNHLLKKMNGSSLRYFLPIFHTGLNLAQQRCDLAFGPNGDLRTPHEFIDVFSKDVLAAVLKIILGIIHYRLNFVSSIEALAYVYSNSGPPISTLLGCVEEWIVGPSFLNIVHGSSSATSNVADKKSRRLLLQFLSVVALLQGPFRDPDACGSASTSPTLQSCAKLASPIEVSAADQFLAHLGNSRSQFRPPLHTSTSPHELTDSDGQNLDDGPVKDTQLCDNKIDSGQLQRKRIVINTLD